MRCHLGLYSAKTAVSIAKLQTPFALPPISYLPQRQFEKAAPDVRMSELSEMIRMAFVLFNDSGQSQPVGFKDDWA